MITSHRFTICARLNLRHLVNWTLLALALLAVGLWNLDGPAPWWDEGWTLSVARNWAADGHYGRLRNGERIAGGLAASFTTTVPVGLSMRLFGVGLWQGRLFGVLSTVGALLLLAALAQRLYGRGAATATMFVALAMTMHAQIHPLLQGRQVLAEMPMLFYLLAGYLCLWWGLAGRLLALLPAALLLGTAWISKGQTMPFLVLSLLTPLLVALAVRRWQIAAVLALVLTGAWLTAQTLPLLAQALLNQPDLPSDPIAGLTAVIALVLTPFNRLYALSNLLVFGLPTLLGLLWALWALWCERAATTRARCEGAGWYLRLTLLVFVGSWLAWFAALSVGVPRYMAPPVLVGSIFVAELLRMLTGGFQLRQMLQQRITSHSLHRVKLARVAGLLVISISLGIVVITVQQFVSAYAETNHAGQRVATALNGLPVGTRIETYESELHFFLNQSYHFPPDQIHVDLNRRTLLGEDRVIAYDPLIAAPDYLVVGNMARWWHLYAPVIASDAFKLAWRDGQYEVYQRVRPEVSP